MFRVIGNGAVDEETMILVKVVLGSVISSVEMTGTAVFLDEGIGPVLPLEGFGELSVEGGFPDWELEIFGGELLLEVPGVDPGPEKDE